MSSEQNAPEVQMHQGPPPAPMNNNGSGQDASQGIGHGMGQSKSSRRRRRKRKNKTDGPQAGQLAGDMQASAPSAPSAQPQQGHGQPNGGFQQQGAPSTKRWKKKFRDRDRHRGASGDNPGNQASAGGGYSNTNSAPSRDRDTHQPGNTAGGFGKRKSGGGGKQRDRGPRGFVGPMDHSYRAVNGNFADGPPSTMESQGFHGRNGGGGGRGYVAEGSGPIDYSIGRPVPIPDDAPTKIYFFIDDLFFNAKITETARKLGVKVAFVKADKEVIAELTSKDEDAERPGLIVFDLNNAAAKPLTLIPKLKAKLKKTTSIIGFLSHLQGDLKAKAVEAGCDTVMPRAAFSQNLPNLLRRYGLHEEEEENFNQ